MGGAQLTARSGAVPLQSTPHSVAELSARSRASESEREQGGSRQEEEEEVEEEEEALTKGESDMCSAESSPREDSTRERMAVLRAKASLLNSSGKEWSVCLGQEAWVVETNRYAHKTEYEAYLTVD